MTTNNNPFKVGDRVRFKGRIEMPFSIFITGIGTVIEVSSSLEVVKVQWPSGKSYWEHLHQIEFVENPIERMKRRYEESIQSR